MDNPLMLFSPLHVTDTLVCKNRIVMAPVFTGWLFSTPEFASFYLRRVRGGIGMLIVPIPTYGGFDDLRKPDFIKTAKALTTQCRKYDCKVIAQIFSGVGEEVTTKSADELNRIPDRFAVAVSDIKNAGFDGFEIHAAHHSLFMHLLTPLINRRSDCFGGTFENRTQLQLWTVRAIRSAVGPDFPLFFRFCASDLAENGVGLKETVPFASMLEKAGVDCIDVSAGGTPVSPPYSMSPNASREGGCFAPFGEAIKKNVSVPIIIAGKIATRGIAENILRSGQADLVAICRQLLADPDWPRKIRDNEEHLITACRYTNIGCFRESIDKGLTIRCSQNPGVGFDHETDGVPDEYEKAMQQ